MLSSISQMAICPSSVEGGKLPTSYPTLRPPTGLPYTPYPPSTSRLPNHLPYTYPTPTLHLPAAPPGLALTSPEPPTLHPPTKSLPTGLPYTKSPSPPVLRLPTGLPYTPHPAHLVCFGPKHHSCRRVPPPARPAYPTPLLRLGHYHTARPAPPNRPTLHRAPTRHWHASPACPPPPQHRVPLCSPPCKARRAEIAGGLSLGNLGEEGLTLSRS